MAPRKAYPASGMIISCLGRPLLTPQSSFCVHFAQNLLVQLKSPTPFRPRLATVFLAYIFADELQYLLITIIISSSLSFQYCSGSVKWVFLDHSLQCLFLIQKTLSGLFHCCFFTLTDNESCKNTNKILTGIYLNGVSCCTPLLREVLLNLWEEFKFHKIAYKCHVPYLLCIQVLHPYIRVGLNKCSEILRMLVNMHEFTFSVSLHDVSTINLVSCMYLTNWWADLTNKPNFFLL